MHSFYKIIIPIVSSLTTTQWRRYNLYQNQYTEHYSCISTIHHSDDTLYSSPAQLSFIVVLMIDGLMFSELMTIKSHFSST